MEVYKVRVVELTRDLAMRKGKHIKPYVDWPDGINYCLLNLQAERLKEDNLALYLQGKKTDVKNITEKLVIHNLTNFLYEVLNGFLTNSIIEAYTEQDKYTIQLT